MTLTVMEAPYPSVDCTFWWQSRVDTECLIRILDAVSKGHVVAVVEQHCILPHVHRYPDQCARLINLDCSSDLGGLEDICVDGYPGLVINHIFCLHFSGITRRHPPWSISCANPAKS